MREDPRVDTNYRAKMINGHGRQVDAYVANVSRSGFRLSTNVPLAIGDVVSICAEDGEIYSGVIQWADGTEAGGKFSDAALLPDSFGRLMIEPSTWRGGTCAGPLRTSITAR